MADQVRDLLHTGAIEVHREQVRLHAAHAAVVDVEHLRTLGRERVRAETAPLISILNLEPSGRIVKMRPSSVRERSNAPSGDQSTFGFARSVHGVICFAKAVARSATKRALPFALLRTNATFCPFGDRAGLSKSPTILSARCGVPPPAGTTHNPPERRILAVRTRQGFRSAP